MPGVRSRHARRGPARARQIPHGVFEELLAEFMSPADVRRGIERHDLAAIDFHSDATDFLARATVACLMDRDATAQRGCERILDSGSQPGPGHPQY